MEKDRWIELHRHFSENWDYRSNSTWETVKLNTALSSALTSLATYSIIYLYTNSFFWETSQFTTIERNVVRTSLLLIPVILLIVNIMSYRNFKRQCKRMYDTLSVIIKIQEMMGLYDERSRKEKFPEDKWYVPNYWKSLCFSTSKDFVEDSMKNRDRYYKNMLWLFRIFGLVSIGLIIIETGLLLLH